MPEGLCDDGPVQETERFYVSRLRGHLRLYRRYVGEDGRWHNQVLPVTDDDLATAEGVEHARAVWKREIILYPCHWCGKQMEITRDQLLFLSVHMLNRYHIGALPTCSKECAERLVSRYELAVRKG